MKKLVLPAKLRVTSGLEYKEEEAKQNGSAGAIKSEGCERHQFIANTTRRGRHGRNTRKPRRGTLTASRSLYSCASTLIRNDSPHCNWKATHEQREDVIQSRLSIEWVQSKKGQQEEKDENGKITDDGMTQTLQTNRT